MVLIPGRDRRPLLNIEGTVYEQRSDLDLEFSSGFSDGVEIRARLHGSGHYLRQPVNKCGHCHRADWTVVVCRSIAEAVERGWLTRTDRDPLCDQL